MTDYLALALAQWEETSAIMAEELSAAAEDVSRDGKPLFPPEWWKHPLGAIFSAWKRRHPRPPEKMPGGESFDSLSPWIPTLTDQGRGAAAPLALEPSPGRPTAGEEARFPHFVAGTGHGGPAATPKPAKLGRINGKLYRQNGIFQRLVSKFGGLMPQHGNSGVQGPQPLVLSWGDPGGYSLASKNSPPEAFVSRRDEMISAPTPGWEIPSARDGDALPLLRQVRQAQWNTGFVQSQRRQFAVALPEADSAVSPLSVEELDLACERDARRYGGGFALY